MSARLVGLLLDRCFMPPHKKLVAVALADAANPDGSSIFVGKERLARRAGVSVSTVKKVMTELIGNGGLVLVKKGGKGPGDPNVYSMSERALLEAYPLPPEEEKGAPDDPLPPDEKGACGDPLETKKGAPETPKGSQLVTPTPPYTQRNKTRAREAPPEGSATASEPRSVSGDGESPSPEASDGDPPGKSQPRRKACDAWRVGLPRLVGSLGPETVVAWLLALIPDSDDGAELRLLAPSALWRRRVADWRIEIEAATGRAIAFGLQAEAGIPVTRDPKRRYPNGWRAPYAETAERELRLLVEVGALDPQWLGPPGEGWRGAEGWAAQERAGEIWRRGLPVLVGVLAPDALDWLVRAAAPWSLDATALSVVLPGRTSQERRAARETFERLAAQASAALGETLGAPLDLRPTICRAAEEPIAEAAARAALEAAEQLGLLSAETEADQPRAEGVGR